jgi:hypothetical protein
MARAVLEGAVQSRAAWSLRRRTPRQVNRENATDASETVMLSGYLHVGLAADHVIRTDQVERGEVGIEGRRRSSFLHLEAEHHSALVVFGDVAMRHPQARVGDVEEDVHRLTGSHKHGVLPHQARLDYSVAT